MLTLVIAHYVIVVANAVCPERSPNCPLSIRSLTDVKMKSRTPLSHCSMSQIRHQCTIAHDHCHHLPTVTPHHCHHRSSSSQPPHIPNKICFDLSLILSQRRRSHRPGRQVGLEAPRNMAFLYHHHHQPFQQLY